MTLPPTPENQLGNAPFFDLMRVLLSQFKRLLADNDVPLTADETLAVARAIANDQTHDKLTDIQRIMQQLVDESVGLIQNRWGLTFAECLDADMNTIQAWETTAEFLEIANDKSNAELRVSAGSTLLVAMRNLNYMQYLLDVIKHDAGVMDVDAVFAKRALTHIGGVDDDADDWLQQFQTWYTSQS